MEKRAIVHFEIPMTDKDQSTAFYRDLCGWEFQTDDEFDYTSIATGNVGGGFSPVNAHNKPGDVLMYLHSDDIDADLKRVEALGGTIIAPRMDIGTMGALAVFADPIGNKLAFWQNLS